MDINHFDRYTRMFAAATSRRRLVSLFAALSLTGVGHGTGTAKKKVTLCYQGQTTTVGKKAKKRYLAQGATAGACPPPAPPAPPPPPCVGTCAGKICGDDGCGRQCGLCAVGLVCEANRCCFPCVNGACCPGNEICLDHGGGVFTCLA
jgi:hypothetical protein